ncbi:MAG: radical SAM protein [Clostridia bacterium]|jgi:pyruvate formate lyase activating enzyme|nr:radical SAM protein [Clostridia bacterium]
MKDNGKKDIYATCHVCWRQCRIKEGGLGYCRARTVKDGVVIPESYGKLTSLALDPIEKKPLSFFHPGTMILSAGSYGCNMACPFCQNYEIAREAAASRHTIEIGPKALVEKALALKDRENIGIAFTYNEPLVGYEYIRDTATLARDAGLLTVVVTNGQIEEEPLRELLPLISAWNIDLKSFSEDAYKKLGGRLEVTLRTIELASATAHVEITTLVVPGLSDDESMMREEAAFLAAIDPAMPLHLSRYFPCYEYHAPATAIQTMYRLQGVAKESLERVVLGNIH